MTTINGPCQQDKYEVHKIGSDLLVVEPTIYEEKIIDIVNNAKKKMEQLIYLFVCKLGATAAENSIDHEIDYYCKLLSKDNKFMNTVDYLYKNNHKFFENGCTRLT